MLAGWLWTRKINRPKKTTSAADSRKYDTEVADFAQTAILNIIFGWGQSTLSWMSIAVVAAGIITTGTLFFQPSMTTGLVSFAAAVVTGLVARELYQFFKMKCLSAKPTQVSLPSETAAPTPSAQMQPTLSQRGPEGTPADIPGAADATTATTPVQGAA